MPDRPVLDDWLGAPPPLRGLATGLLESGVESSRRTAALFVPGRIELFGKHTDYAGGRSLLAATDRGLTLLVAPRGDSLVRWRDLGRRVETGFDAAECEDRPGHWSNYLRVVARRLAMDFGACESGMDVAMVSDLPAAAGLSSSSALVVAAFLALDSVNEPRRNRRFESTMGSREDLAGYLGSVEAGRGLKALDEGGGVGTRGGSEDHTAILCSRRGRLRQYRFDPIELEREVPFDRRWQLLVAVSGVHAKKTGGARERFNRLAELATAAAEAWRRASGTDDPHLGAALATSADLTRPLEEAVASHSPETAKMEVLTRVRHFVAESGKIVPAATEAFAAGDRESLGALAERSQLLATQWLRNQVPETSSLASLARQEGAFAASAFGAGFGGAVWALSETSEAERLLTRWRRAYRAAFPRLAGVSEFFATEPSAGSRWLTPDLSGKSRGETT